MTTETVSAVTRIKEERAKWIAEWFANHKATMTTFTTPDGRAIEALRWTNPASGFYRIDYLCDGPHLMVTGDMDDAIYEAGAKNLAWWAQCDADYFHGKCIASPHGRRPFEWDASKARESINETIDEIAEDAPNVREAWRAWDGDDALATRESWDAWLSDNASTVFGANWTDFEPWNIGNVRAMAVEAHLAGLKLALAQVRDASQHAA